MSPRPSRLLPILAWLLLQAVLALPASAHAVLVEASPADGARLEAAPETLSLRFSEPVQPIEVRLLDGAGGRVDATVTAQDDRLEVRPDGPLADGVYLLAYHVTSLDSHPVGATLRFGVRADPGGTGGAVTADPGIRWAGLMLRWLGYLAVLGAIGAWLFQALLAPPAGLAARAGHAQRLLALAGIGVLLLRFGQSGAELAGQGLAELATLRPWQVAAGATLGRALLAQILGLGLLAWCAGRPGRLHGMAAIALILLGFASTGHAATAPPRWLMSPALALHVLMAAFWVGAFLPLLWSLTLAPAAAAALLRRFSALATAALVLLVGAGLVLAWVQLGGRIAAAWQTDYGLRLMAKLALVLGLLVVAAVNRWRLVPALAAGDPWAVRALRRTLGLDLALAAGVLLATASFPLGPPARALGEAGEPMAADGLSIQVAEGGRTAVLTLLPGRTGANRLEAWVTAADGAPVEAKEAMLRIGAATAGLPPQRLPATMVRPGLYVAEGLVLPMAGTWQVRLDLLIDDFTKLLLEGEVRLP